MRIAHLSDLHILDLKNVGFRRFFSRRMLGGLNLLSFRHEAHSAAVFERLLEDLLDQRPDHVVITGDVSNLALESEFERVAAYLRLMWDYHSVSIVPGNHDYYTPGAIRTRRFEKAFYPYMFPDFTDMDVSLYPYAKPLGPVTLFGMCSATHNAPLYARGEVDADQIERFVHLVNEPQHRRSYKVVLIHHNLYERRAWSDFSGTLVNRKELADLFLVNGIDLVLHGHDHTAHIDFLHGGGRRIPTVGSGSSTATSRHPLHAARYNLYTFDGGELAAIESRRYDDATRSFLRLRCQNRIT